MQLNNNQNDLSKLKEYQLNILEDIITVCKNDSLNYFIIAGTLIGAIRHQGFIPWDDDIDIAMTRSDYIKFKEAVIMQYSSKYFIQDYDSEPLYYKSFAKLRLNNTLYDELEVSHLEIHKGIFVDIFILDEEVNVDKLSFHFRATSITALRSLISYKHVVKGSDEIGLKAKIILLLSSPISSKTLKKMQTILMMKNFGNSNSSHLLNYGCGYGYEKQTFEVEDYFPAKYARFEHLEVAIPNNYHKMLTKIYGEYMIIPKEEDRITHSPSRIEFY